MTTPKKSKLIKQLLAKRRAAEKKLSRQKLALKAAQTECKTATRNHKSEMARVEHEIVMARRAKWRALASKKAKAYRAKERKIQQARDAELRKIQQAFDAELRKRMLPAIRDARRKTQILLNKNPALLEMIQNVVKHNNSKCPSQGDGHIIGWKKVRHSTGTAILKLLIPSSARRNQCRDRGKCRASEVYVIDVQPYSTHSVVDVVDNVDFETLHSGFNVHFKWKVCSRMIPNRFDTTSDECAAGLHFFLTRKQAAAWIC